MRTSRRRSWASHDLGRTRRLMLIAAAAVTILLSTGCVTPPPVPTDAQDTCPLSAATFASWFESGSVSLNGVVKPADIPESTARLRFLCMVGANVYVADFARAIDLRWRRTYL